MNRLKSSNRASGAPRHRAGHALPSDAAGNLDRRQGDPKPESLGFRRRHEIIDYPAILLALFVLAAPSLAPAQYTPRPASPFPGFANETLPAGDPDMSARDIAANYRARYEAKLGAGSPTVDANWDFSKRPLDDINQSLASASLRDTTCFYAQLALIL